MAESRQAAKNASKKAVKKASARPKAAVDKTDGEATVTEAIAQMPKPDRVLGERLHAIVKSSAPSLVPRLWYGMPAYSHEGKVVCFFQSAQKFKTRYATVGFMHAAKLDDGAMWPTAFALIELTSVEEAKLRTLIEKAVG